MAEEQGQEDVHAPDDRGGRRGKGLGGPLGLGDPEDTNLRKIEMTHLVNQRMVYVVDELCKDIHKVFQECVEKNQVSCFYKCREQLGASRECYKSWMDDERVKEICIEDYLKDRSRYRITGKPLFVTKGEREKVLRKRAVKLAETIKNSSG